LKNEYPHQVVKKVIRNNNMKKEVKEEEYPTYLTLLCIKGVSEKIERKHRQCSIRIVVYTSKERKRDQNERVGVVYRIHCSPYHPCYIGLTGRTLNTRIKEHKYALKTVA